MSVKTLKVVLINDVPEDIKKLKSSFDNERLSVATKEFNDLALMSQGGQNRKQLKSIAKFQPHMIITNFANSKNQNRVDGLRILRHLRENDTIKETPVIVWTDFFDKPEGKEYQDRAKKIGCQIVDKKGDVKASEFLSKAGVAAAEFTKPEKTEPEPEPTEGEEAAESETPAENETGGDEEKTEG